MSKSLAKEFDKAIRSLNVLIDLTHDIITHHTKRGDAAGVSKVIFEQRHNLKVLFRQLEKARGGKK